jgi:branched-chain amino acid transport system ATP-binding protein
VSTTESVPPADPSPAADPAADPSAGGAPGIAPEAPPTDALLSVRQLTVTYGTPTPAVDHLDFHVGEREAIALLGSNGAGKTSTLNAVSNIIPSSGDIVFDGERLARKPPEKIARAGIIQVPEGRRLFAGLSAEENLIIGTTARNKREPLFSLDDIYDLFPQLRDLRKRGAWTLSGGEQQMVAIGRGLLAAPRVLMLDEPSLGLAPIVVAAVYEALRSIAHRVAIVLVEQNAGLALDLCDRAYILTTGRLALSGKPSELPDRNELLATYLAE